MWFFSDEARLLLSCLSFVGGLLQIPLFIILLMELFRARRLKNFTRLTQPTKDQLRDFQLKYGETERKKLEAQLREIFEKKPS